VLELAALDELADAVEADAEMPGDLVGGDVAGADDLRLHGLDDAAGTSWGRRGAGRYC
jgi:hypothetical protein